MSDESKSKKVDTGLKVALKSIGIQEVPESVSEQEYQELSGKVSQGVRLRMEQKAKEQNMVLMWKSRVNLVKQARQFMAQKSYSEAAVSYEKYLRVLEMVYEKPHGGLSPEIFNNSSRSKELTIIASVYWDLVRIYDTSNAYGDRMGRAAEKLALFLPHSTLYPHVSKAAQSFQRSCKHPAVIRRLLKSLKLRRKGCFVATSLYGDPNHPDVLILRHFRDDHLMTCHMGRLFVRLYYASSPHFVVWLSDKPRVKKVLKPCIGQLVRWVNR